MVPVSVSPEVNPTVVNEDGVEAVAPVEVAPVTAVSVAPGVGVPATALTEFAVVAATAPTVVVPTGALAVGMLSDAVPGLDTPTLESDSAPVISL